MLKAMNIDNKKNISERVAREEHTHDEDSVLEESYKLKNRFHHIWCYPSRKRLDLHKAFLLKDINGCQVLDYGCGWGEKSLKYYEHGANVTGIDISARFVQLADESFQDRGFDKNRYKFIKMDAHLLKFDDKSFDYIIGDGILHHLDARTALAEIYRVLKPGGRVILFEPLAGHPLLKIFRLITPKARTVDEAPLTTKDLELYSSLHPWESDNVFCGIIEAPVAMLTSLLMPNKPVNILLDIADILECWMVSKRLLLSWNQYVLLNFKK